MGSLALNDRIAVCLQLFDKEMLQNTTETFPDLFTTAHTPSSAALQQDDDGVGRGPRSARATRIQLIRHCLVTRAESVVNRCLETIRKLTGEPMCVISNYPFHNYLEKKFTPLHTRREKI